MAVILEKTKSTYGNPYAYYKLETTSVSDRTANSVKVTYKITSNLASSGSSLGVGYSLDARIYTNGSWSDYISVKASSDSWSGTTEHTKTITLTTTGISSSATKLTNVKFQVKSYANDKCCQLNTISCKDITIPTGHQAPDIDVNGIQVTENVTYLKNTIGIDNDDFINGVSIKTFTISATPYDGATITKFTLQNGSYSEETTNITNNSGTITMNFQTHPITITPSSSTLSGSYDRIVFTISATDSSGGVATSTFYYNVTMMNYGEYNKPTIIPTNVTAKRDGQLTGKVNLNASGTYPIEIGTGNHTQSLTPTLTMNVYETGSSTLVFTRNITTSDTEFVLSGTSWTLTNLQIGATSGTNYFNPQKMYDIVLSVNDAVTTNVSTITPYSYTANVLQGEPTWVEYKDRVDFKRITRQRGEIYGETELYNDPSGSTSSITLNDSVSNYTYLEIFYGWSGFGHQSTRCYVPLGGNVNLGTIVVNNGAIYWAESEWTPTTNKINLSKGEYWRLQTSGSGTRSTTNQISIYRVVGYK